VKTLHWVPSGKYYQADTKTSNGSKGNRAYTSEEIDYLGVVSLEYERIWMVPLSATKGVTSLRWHPPEKNHRRRFDSFNWSPYLINKGCIRSSDTYSAKFS
jgi:hypothetical protein